MQLKRPPDQPGLINTGNRLLIIFAGIVSLVYLANLFSPLRLTTDTVRYFELAERMNGTWPARLTPRNDFLPYGYVILLVVLSKLKILSSFTICLINSLYLAGSCWYVTKIFSPGVKKWSLIIFTLLSWIVIKLSVLPLSEMQFLFFTIGSLWYFQQYAGTKKVKYILLSALFCGLSIFTRTAGVALLVSLMISFLIINRKQITQWIRQRAILTGVLLVLILLSVIYIFSSYSFLVYVNFITQPLKKDPVSFFATNIQRHLVDWAELFINIPFSKASLYYPSSAWVLYTITGLIALAIILRSLFYTRISIPASVKVYIVVYLLLIFNWPFYETRFWIPIIPLLGGVMLQQTINVKAIYKNLALMYKLYFIVAGICALGYYTWLSFNKPALANKQEEGIFKVEYQKHFFNRSAPDSIVNRKALYILEKYD